VPPISRLMLCGNGRATCRRLGRQRNTKRTWTDATLRKHRRNNDFTDVDCGHRASDLCDFEERYGDKGDFRVVVSAHAQAG